MQFRHPPSASSYLSSVVLLTEEDRLFDSILPSPSRSQHDSPACLARAKAGPAPPLGSTLPKPSHSAPIPVGFSLMPPERKPSAPSPNLMRQALKYLLAVAGGVAIHVLGTALWESSLFSGWRTKNPISTSGDWLFAGIALSRLSVLLLLLLFALSLSFVAYLYLQSRRILVHWAVYSGQNANKDVTQFLRDKVEKSKLRRVPATNDFLGCDPEYGTPKTLTVEYSISGRRRNKKVKENQNLKFD